MRRSRALPASALVALLISTFAAATACRHPEPSVQEAENLTVGKVQGEIKVGMSAASVAEILGSPNIVTTDEQRREVWIYDKVSSSSVDTSNSFGGTLIILGGQTSQREHTKSQRTLTVIIKYDENKLVRDFAYNASQF